MSEIDIGAVDFAPEISTHFDFEPAGVEGFGELGTDFEVPGLFEEAQTDVFEPSEVELFPDEEYVITSEDVVLPPEGDVLTETDTDTAEHVPPAEAEDRLVSDETTYVTEQQLEDVRKEISDLVASEKNSLSAVEKAAVMMIAASMLAEKAKKKKREEEDENKGLLVTLIKMLGTFMQSLADPERMGGDAQKNKKSLKVAA